MAPEDLRFGGGATGSVMSPLFAVWLLVAIVLIFVLPRRSAILPFLIAFFTIPVGEVIVLGGIHLTALRILILVVLGRRLTFSRLEKYPGGVSSIDWAVILWSISAFIAFYLQFPGTPALIQGLGVLLDTLGGYFAARSLIPDGEAVRNTIKALAIICVIQGIVMINEQISHVNLFGLLGGLPTLAKVWEREGRLRSSGIFGYLWAGAFAGVLIPLFVWLLKDRKSRLVAFAGLAGAVAMVITSNSSTSLLALFGGFVGLAFWPLRKMMRFIRWGIVAILIGLNMVMKAPVWALIARIDLTGSSSSYQRYGLVDMTIRHFSAWWLIGTPDYINWGWDAWDLCNQFAAVALTGGLLSLIFYIGIFKQGFGTVGDARKQVSGDRQQEWMLWCFGSALFANVVAHFGINYMAQLIMGFLPVIACICVVTSQAKLATADSAERPSGSKWASYGLWEWGSSHDLGEPGTADSLNRLALKENRLHP